MIKLQGRWSVKLHWGPVINQLPFSCDESGWEKNGANGGVGGGGDAIQEMTMTAAAAEQIRKDVTGMSDASRLFGLFK